MRIINKEVCSIMRTNVTWKVYYFNLEICTHTHTHVNPMYRLYHRIFFFFFLSLSVSVPPSLFAHASPHVRSTNTHTQRHTQYTHTPERKQSEKNLKFQFVRWLHRGRTDIAFMAFIRIFGNCRKYVCDVLCAMCLAPRAQTYCYCYLLYIFRSPLESMKIKWKKIWTSILAAFSVSLCAPYTACNDSISVYTAVVNIRVV